MSPGGVAHRRELHKGGRETLYLLQTSAEGLYLMESSNLRGEREGGREGGREERERERVREREGRRDD